MAKILLVEDDKSLREIYGVRLLAEGYDIVSAGDGEEALAMAIKERPQLIVSDVMMPKISGFDMLDILRSTTETKDIKVIMMTALSSEDQRQRGEQLGADRYLVKSQVGIEDVVRTVHEVLGDSLAPQQNAFGSNTPSAVPRPAPVLSSTPSPAATVPAPAAPTMPAPAAPAAPVAPTPAPQQPMPQPTAPATALPQPTAPFSTARPAGLADRIIQPIERPDDNSEHIGSLMDKELGQATAEVQPLMPTPPPAPAAPAAPPVPPMPQPAVAPQPQPQVQAPQQPMPQQPENHGISFEETPRQPGQQ
jgi:CheY-like chemotaxis protein